MKNNKMCSLGYMYGFIMTHMLMLLDMVCSINVIRYGV